MGKNGRRVGGENGECENYNDKHVNPCDTRRRRQGKEETQGGGEEEEKEGGGEFFACYLLTSLSPRYKGHTYIGYSALSLDTHLKPICAVFGKFNIQIELTKYTGMRFFFA